MASNLGGMGQTVGATWLMTSMAPRADMVALVQAATAAPIMLLALVAGAMADNFDRRKIMLGAQLFMLASAAALAGMTFAHLVTPAWLLFFTFLIGIGLALNAPAWQASVGDMVPREDIAEAVALNSVGLNIARSTGPALGGVIVAAIGAAGTFALNAISYVGLVIVLLRWRPVRPSRVLPPERLWTAIGAGLRYSALSPNIRVVLLRGAVFGLGAGAILALMPLVARNLLLGGPVTYGLLLAAFGIGAIGGAFLIGQVRGRLSTEASMRLYCCFYAAAALGLGWSRSLPLSALALALAGAGWVMALSSFNVSIQMASPRWVVARALSLYQMTMFGGMAAGAWFWGETAARVGIPVALSASALPMLVNALLGLILPLASAADLDLAPLRDHREPATALPIAPSSGPVAITIEYRIAQEDVFAFLAAMADWRRIRRRDGARNWTLSRDLHDPEIWLERYRAATWLDYLRHNHRITRADAPAHQAIHSLHRGEAPPRVSRVIERQTGSLPDRLAVHNADMAGH
jgi:MFS family permease